LAAPLTSAFAQEMPLHFKISRLYPGITRRRLKNELRGENAAEERAK